MNLNEYINYLISIRDKYNAGNCPVMNSEIVCDVICGEIDTVSTEPIPMEEKNCCFDENTKMIYIYPINDGKCY